MEPNPLPPTSEAYLKQVRQGLSSLSAADRDDILLELRSHLSDRIAQGSPDPLVGFEAPEALAANLVEELALRGALARGTSLALARALLVAARDSLLGLLVVAPLLLAQVLALACLISAVAKLFMPDRIGLWVGPGAFFIGNSNNGDPRVHEVLGPWGAPVMAIAGVLIFWVSFRAMRALARWRLRLASQRRR